MKKILILIALIATSFMFSCKESIKEPSVSPSDIVYKKVMEIHDAVMPEMGTIHRLKKELRKFQESSNATDTTILDQIQRLDKADDGMMDWMGNLAIPEDEDSRLKYLKEQLPLIQNVSDEMTNTIADATTLVETLKAKNEK